MADTYTIYVLNTSINTEIFWCFLGPTPEQINDPRVYANSSASVEVAPNEVKYFVMPSQYSVGAGAGKYAVGLGAQITPDVAKDTELGDVWNTSYATVPPVRAPTISLSIEKSEANTITILTNDFDLIHNEDDGWFSNQSFGIQTSSGFVGISWSPVPALTRVLTPKLTFYVATGYYGKNVLASWSDVYNSSIKIDFPSDFKLNKCVVAYRADGSWGKC